MASSFCTEAAASTRRHSRWLGTTSQRDRWAGHGRMAQPIYGAGRGARQCQCPASAPARTELALSHRSAAHGTPRQRYIEKVHPGPRMPAALSLSSDRFVIRPGLKPRDQREDGDRDDAHEGGEITKRTSFESSWVGQQPRAVLRRRTRRERAAALLPRRGWVGGPANRQKHPRRMRARQPGSERLAAPPRMEQEPCGTDTRLTGSGRWRRLPSFARRSCSWTSGRQA